MVVVKEVARYQGEYVCARCMATVIFEIRSYWAHLVLRESKLDEYFSEPSEYAYLALELAKTWSKVRINLQVQPEFPAGLEIFMRQMGWLKRWEKLIP